MSPPVSASPTGEVMREPTMQSNDGLYPDKRVLAHRTQDENLASPKNITSKLDMAFGPAKIQRPQSSGNKDLAAGFQYSTAKKVQPVLNIHGKLGVAGVLPDSLRQRHMQPAAGNDELGHSPRAKDLIHIEHESAIDRTIETGDVSSANIKLHGSNIPLQFPPGNPPQSDSVPFNLRPELRPLKAFGSGKVMTNSDNLMQSIEVDAKSSLESSCTDAQIQADGQIEPVENSGIDKTPTKKNRDHSSSLQKLHVVKGASRVNKAKHVQGGRSRTPQTLQGISQLDLTNEQILQLFLSNFRKEKIQSTGLQSQMKHQIEQLVRVNGDYQTKLEEAEQEIEMQGREILKYKDKLSKWKQDLLHLNSRMGGLVEDHSAMNMSIKQLKDAKKDYLSSRASATKDIEKSREHLAIMRGELTQLNALVHDHEHTTKSIVAKLDLMEDKYKQKASQLLKEETRTVRLEAFVEHEIKQLRTQSPLFNKTLEQFMGRISTMEHMIEQLNRLNIDTVKTTGTRGENPDIAACIELLRRLHDAERVMPSDIDKLGASIAKLEERFAEIAQNGSRCTQIASEANRALGINLDKQLTEIKESIATSKASLEEQEQLQFQLVRLDEATKQQRTLIAEVGKAKEFAEQQATLPQVDVRTLLQHIESLQASLTEHSKTAQEQRELQVTTDMRKIANLKSSLEDEKKKNTTLTKELDSSKLAASKKEEMLGSLSGELVSVKEQQRELGKGSEQAQKRLEEVLWQLDEKTANISVLEIRLTELNTKSTLQVATIDDLRAKLGQEIVSKEELKAKIELLESVKQELEEARQTSSSRLALIQEQEITIKASEGVQRELDVQLAERAKLNDRVASLEQRSKDYENLKAKYKSLEIEAAELQASRVQNLQLNSELIEKSSEQAKLKDRIQELETKIIQSQHLTRPFIHPSQGSPEITSQDLTPGTKAAFDELIEPDMLDGDGFSNDHPRSEQRKSSQSLSRQGRRKANRNIIDESRPSFDPFASSTLMPDPTPSQETACVPETQPQASQATEILERTIARSSSLTQLSSQESLFDASRDSDEDSSLRRKTFQEIATRSKSVQSFIRNQSAETLVGTNIPHYTELPGEVARKDPSPRRLRSGSQQDVLSRGTEQNLRKHVEQTPRAALPQSPANTTKEKPRPNSAAKRRADSIENSSSPSQQSIKRMKRNLTAVEVKQTKKGNSIRDQLSQAASSPRPMLRYSLPIGSKGSGSSLNSTSAGASTSVKKTKKTKSNFYESRFNR